MFFYFLELKRCEAREEWIKSDFSALLHRGKASSKIRNVFVHRIDRFHVIFLLTHTTTANYHVEGFGFQKIHMALKLHSGI